ncbi:flagellar biosynthesis anti-sigma factor FlgM [Edaphobacter modestus]|uniref:Negative regulator of flagellin synthesis n=1 Tax=Edaphobacter modestus TaxID=388466 RepID=A0A4Q7YRK7_9BACT|nr:flagellar biosynthesis anti-sigma factor FlgM [Edaphobacter modestus]RZU39543.1 FlgM family anti-sigma-28 factor [Edaphobacter modestus]
MSYSNGIGDRMQVSNPIAPASASQTRPAEAKTAEAQPAGRTGTDAATLSPTGELISQALGGSDVRSSKVEALQKAIADGSYNVSSSDVAGKVMDSLLK